MVWDVCHMKFLTLVVRFYFYVHLVRFGVKSLLSIYLENVKFVSFHLRT